MRLGFKIKHHFFSAFRELFVHHHGSLEFRAKIFALVIGADKNAMENSYVVIKNYALQIYKNDEDRANLLLLTTKELINKIHENNGLDIDILISNIQKELKIVPRYAKKIDVEPLEALLELTRDADTLSYQENILEFLQTLKDETLYTKKTQIAQDEENLESKY